MKKSQAAIRIWAGASTDSQDPRTHFWYEGTQGQWRKLCDDAPIAGEPKSLEDTDLFVPCRLCKELYTEDITFGRQVLAPSLVSPIERVAIGHDIVVHSHATGVYTQSNGGHNMIQGLSIGMATFARFCDASNSQQGIIVQDARTWWADPRGYAGRDYYRDLRNTLRKTHWATNDIATFEDTFDHLIAQQSNPARSEHYRALGQRYIAYWKKQEAHFFAVEETTITLAGLTILINPEVGMSWYGGNFVLKLWFAAPKPKREYTLAIQFLMNEAQRQGWRKDLQPALWDIRREVILPPLRVPRDFRLVIEGKAAAFQQIWNSLGTEI